MRRLTIAAVVLTGLSANVAQAATLYNNITATPYGGDCSFSTTCAAAVGRGNDYAAQFFTLDNAADLTSASFAEFDYGTGPTAANWIISTAAGSLPGVALFSGSSDVNQISTIGSGFGLTLSQVGFDLGTIKLSAGSYFFAVQAVSPVFSTYLASGLSEGGAAETFDGGASWSQGYEGIGSVGVALSGTTVSAVPLPAAFPMFGAGLLALGGFGYRARRRRALAVKNVAA